MKNIIESAWENRDNINTATKGEVRDAVEQVIASLDNGNLRVAEKVGADWQINQWVKKAILLSFRLNDMGLMSNAPANSSWFDKVPFKFQGWGEEEFRNAKFRALPGSFVRKGAYIAPSVVLMPSFVNLGAYVG